jgi:hypothetical protein
MAELFGRHYASSVRLARSILARRKRRWMRFNPHTSRLSCTSGAFAGMQPLRRGSRALLGTAVLCAFLYPAGYDQIRSVWRLWVGEQNQSRLPVWSKNSCDAGIELEQSAEPLATLNGVAALLGFICGASTSSARIVGILCGANGRVCLSRLRRAHRAS